MNIQKKFIPLILFTALVIGFLGAYAGIKIAQPKNTAKQPPITLEDKEDKTEGEQPESLSKVIQAFQLIQENYVEGAESDQLYEGAIQGMVEALDDPYSAYMDLEMNDRFMEQIESSFEGIGAEVSMVDGKVTIVSPIKDSPAEEAGLRTNDQIILIDDESIDGLDLNEAVEIIRGEKGSEVILSIQRPGVSEPFEVSLTRDEIPIETVYADIKEIDGKKTGVLTLTSFAENTAEDFANELAAFEEDGIEGLVIDVRGNPGGLLDSVGDILGHFIPEGTPYIQTENQKGEKEPYYSKISGEKDYPISVIIDEGSASASEILAIALKEMDYNIVGTDSFGKGTVQQAIPLGDGSTIKLTISKWLSPNGVWVHEEGIKPTIEQEQPKYYYTHPIQIEEPMALHQTGEKVKNAQQMLDGLGYNIENINGTFDEETEEAVKSFQKENDLKVNGEIDEETAGLIEVKVVESIRNGEDDLQLEEALKALY